MRSLTSGSSHGWVGGPEREQNTSSPCERQPELAVDLVGEPAGETQVLVDVEVALAVARARRCRPSPRAPSG